MNKKLTKGESKQKITDLIKDKLFVLGKKDILETLERLNIDVNTEISKDDLIAHINNKISKKKTTIYYELYKDHKKYFGIGPSTVEDLLNISKYERLKLQKHNRLPINYYFECKMRRNYVDVPMYDIEFVLSKIGTEYVVKSLTAIDKVSKEKAMMNRKIKQKEERDLSKLDKSIAKIESKNNRLINKIFKSNKYIHYHNNVEDLKNAIMNLVKNECIFKSKSKTLCWNKDYKLIAYNTMKATISHEKSKMKLSITFIPLTKLSKNTDEVTKLIELMDIQVIREDLISIEKEKSKAIEDIKNKIIIFDTETTDLSPGQICQLSYFILDRDNLKDGIKLARNMFFNVDKVSSSAFNVHGLSEVTLAERSQFYTFKDYADIIYNDFENSYIVGHNLDFDEEFLFYELEKSINKVPNISGGCCTMNFYTDILQIPHYYGYKWPKLEEVTEFLAISDSTIKELAISQFNECNNYHDARFDLAATYLIYIKL